MSQPLVTASLPHALTVAYHHLGDTLRAGSNQKEIRCAVERFVHEFRLVPAWWSELERRACLVDRLTVPGTAYARARAESLGTYQEQPRELWASEVAGNLRQAEPSPRLLAEIIQQVSWLERVVDQGVLDLSGPAGDAFRRWLQECRTIRREAERLDVDGCHFLYHVHQAGNPDPSERSQAVRAMIEARAVGEVWLEPMRAAVDSLAAWAEGNLGVVRLDTGGATVDQQRREEAGRTPGEDGPAPPNLFRWGAKRIELAPRLWALLAYLWEHHKAKTQDVADGVWGDGASDVRDSTISSTISKLNSRLAEAQIPITVACKGGYVVLTIEE